MSHLSSKALVMRPMQQAADRGYSDTDTHWSTYAMSIFPCAMAPTTKTAGVSSGSSRTKSLSLTRFGATLLKATRFAPAGGCFVTSPFIPAYLEQLAGAIGGMDAELLQQLHHEAAEALEGPRQPHLRVDLQQHSLHCSHKQALHTTSQSLSWNSPLACLLRHQPGQITIRADQLRPCIHRSAKSFSASATHCAR